MLKRQTTAAMCVYTQHASGKHRKTVKKNSRELIAKLRSPFYDKSRLHEFRDIIYFKV